MDHKALLKHLLSVDFPGRRSLQLQAGKATSEILELNGALAVVLEVDPGAPDANVPVRVPVEGVGVDEDGVRIHYLVHVVDGRLAEIEIHREDGGAIKMLPHIESIQVLNLAK